VAVVEVHSKVELLVAELMAVVMLVLVAVTT
jgi:hypothetical protein